MTLGIKERELVSLKISVIIFLIIFNPPIIKHISFTKIFLMIALLTCILKKEIFKQIVFNRVIFRWIKMISLFYLYYMVSAAINMFIYHENMLDIFIYYVSSIGQMVCLFIISIYIAIITVQFSHSNMDILKCYITAGVWQSVIGIACFLRPDVKFFFNSIIAANSSSAKIAYFVMQDHRNFGFANQLYDGFGITMSVLAVAALVCANHGRKKYYIYAGMIAFVAFINARSSIGFIGAGAFAVFIFTRDLNIKEILKKTVVIIISIMLVVILVHAILSSDSNNAVWISTGFKEIMGIFRGEKIGYFDVLLNSFIFFPDSILGNLIGVGSTPMVMASKSTDVGYILNLWQYGIFGSIFIFFFYAYPIRKWANKAESYIFAFPYAIGVMILVYMVKLNCFGYGQVSVLIISNIIIGLYLSYGANLRIKSELEIRTKLNFI